MNYKILIDEVEFEKFLNWLPELGDLESFYVCLFARSKYCKHIQHVSSDKQQLKRLTSNKERLKLKVRQMECAVGAYVDKYDNPVPQEALALYISPTPRDLRKATIKTAQDFVGIIGSNANNYNPHQLCMSNIQRSKGKNKLIIFDYDIPKEEYDPSTGMEGDNYKTKCLFMIGIISKVDTILPKEAVTYIETRGGIHVCVNPDFIPYDKKSKWYKELASIDGIDQTGDSMVPVVGCCQGGWIPRFINRFTFFNTIKYPYLNEQTE